MKKSLSAVVLIASFINPLYAATDKVEAKLKSATEKNLKGQVFFQETDGGVRIVADVSGLKPNSKHGFHVHAVGKCDGPDYKSAGEHFNPEKTKHGDPMDRKSHVGDLGNLKADDKGNAHLELGLIEKEPNELKKLVGKSVVIHKNEDDLETQPSGDSGGRIACGVIRKT